MSNKSLLYIVDKRCKRCQFFKDNYLDDFLEYLDKHKILFKTYPDEKFWPSWVIESFAGHSLPAFALIDQDIFVKDEITSKKLIIYKNLDVLDINFDNLLDWIEKNAGILVNGKEDIKKYEPETDGGYDRIAVSNSHIFVASCSLKL